jgi:hypothetical protein
VGRGLQELAPGPRLTALNAKNVVVDGFVIDQKDQNKYTEPREDRPE